MALTPHAMLPSSAGSGEEDMRPFDSIRIGIASPEQIVSWSYGEVRKPETINYRTFKPERDGLFCARIFGPVKDYECLCGKYKRMKYKDVICEKCGVEVTLASERRQRMGHIALAAPVAHIWFLKSLPSRIALMLDMPLKDVEKILYFERYVITNPGITSLKSRTILDDDQLGVLQDEHGADSFTAQIGADAIRTLLSDIDFDRFIEDLKGRIEKTGSEAKIKQYVRQMKMAEAFRSSGNRPEWMVLTSLPVLPPDLRPLVPLDGGRFATSDLNDLYRRVINRNNRLKRLLELGAPDMIIRNEKRMLQESVDALFDNGRRGRGINGAHKRPLKSLSDMLKGKQGRFRQNLLGKRVDYSARSAIVVGPTLKLHQCGIPKKMALELFKPFLFGQFELRGLSGTIKQAKKIVESERPEVWDILEEVIREHPVLLNRAPTLHRLGIQAFEPVLVEGKAIQLHPLVCAAFNADFDGDQMAVHVPLSIEAQLEARALMMSTNNILHPADGTPIIVPSQDIVLGLYYLSLEDSLEEGSRRSVFGSHSEIEHALQAGALSLHRPIRARVRSVSSDGEIESRVVETTAGRMKIGALLPMRPGVTYDICNRLLTKKEVSAMIGHIYRHCGQKDTVVFCDQLMGLGFAHAFRAGISMGKDDMLVPGDKADMIESTKRDVLEYENQFSEGLITEKEKYNKVVDAWARCTDEIAEKMNARIKDEGDRASRMNSVYMMAHSGARGSPAQMKQLAGMRGLMVKPSGEIMETPITSNFKEGLTVMEYFNSTHGARKGLTDTALKTSNSGYLTRRLVDVAQDSIITEEDCGSDDGVYATPLIESGETIVSIGQRVLGRTTSEDVVSPDSGEVLVERGVEIEEQHVARIHAEDVRRIKIRSPLTCRTRSGLCAKCYGRDLARGAHVNVGEAVGVIAAQSIGEPGTQLTMRTFHIGGSAQVSAYSALEASHGGTIDLRDARVVSDSEGRSIVMNRNTAILIRDSSGVEAAVHKVPLGAQLFVSQDRKVVAGDKIAEWDPYSRPILAEAAGTAKFEDVVDGISMNEEVDEDTGFARRVIADWRGHPRGATLKPAIAIESKDSKKSETSEKASKAKKGAKVSKDSESSSSDDSSRYLLPPEAILSVDPNSSVSPGDVLARIPLEGAQTSDITGGLPRVAELFEARPPKEHAALAALSGRVRQMGDYKNKRRIRIEADEPLDPREVRPGAEGKPIRDEDGRISAVEYHLPRGRHLHARDGDVVERGDPLLDGNASPHDILAIKGMHELASYLINEIQAVYRLQGIAINDKHIEVIARQMMRKEEIIDAGDSPWLEGEYVDKIDLDDFRASQSESGEGKPPISEPILLGITRASLQTKSFISAASFQETTRVLTEAAVGGKYDSLHGLKENVIVGRLIPAGTGCVRNEFQKVADTRDRLIADRRRREDEEKALADASVESSEASGDAGDGVTAESAE